MSEVVSRPSASRGRGSGRGGRGGFAGRGGRRANGDKADHKTDHKADETLGAVEDEGEFAELRKQYGDKTSVICEMFPDWSEIDILYVLQETNGDQSEAVTRIAEGTVSQWGEVSKTKKTPRPKPKETPAPTNPDSSVPRTTRGGRNVTDAGRGRGRFTERGGRGGRGRSTNPAINGTRGKENQPLSTPTEESAAYSGEKTSEASTEERPAAERAAHAEPPKPAAPPVKTWASMLRQSTAPRPAPAVPKEVPLPKPAESIAEVKPKHEPEPQPESVPAEVEAQVHAQAESIEPAPMTQAEVEAEIEARMDAQLEVEATPVAPVAVPDILPAAAAAEPVIGLPPPQDELTKTNLQQVVDDSKPPPTDTAASTAADSWDPRQSPIPAAVTPLSASQHQAQRNAAASGFVTTALKATTDRGLRGPTYQRRVLDQEEAVRMPGNREVDRAAVQFGAFNLGDGDDDIDGEREEAETRAQPPPDSPVAHPRTSLPPASQPVAVPEVLAQKPTTTTTTAPPPGINPNAAQNTGVLGVAHSSQHTQPSVAHTQQFGRFHQAGPQDIPTAPSKPLDHFSQPSTSVSQPPFDNFASQTSQPQAQQPGAAYTSAPAEYSAYYTANQQDRTPYTFYGQHFGQQGAHGQLEPSQQRPFGSYNATHTDNLSQYPQSGAGHNQPRFNANSESQNSGHSTPNPAAQTQQQPTQQTQQQVQQHQAQQHQAQQHQAQQHQAQQHQQQQGAPGTQPQAHGQQYAGYSHPYYGSPYYHQYYSGYGQGGFGPYAKGGMYGQPYGLTPNAPYDHASSPGTYGPTSLHRDNPLGSGLGDYGRAGTGQGNNQPILGGNSSFRNAQDSFSQGAHSFQSQGQGFSSQTQPGAGASAADELKPFGDASKTGSVPASSLGGPRPGSATNTVPGGQTGSLPPPQTSQMGSSYGGYPSHLQGHNVHGSGAYGMSAGSQHSTPYGSYGQGGFSSGYYGAGGQQQQGQQQQQQQQRGGWGGNYH